MGELGEEENWLNRKEKYLNLKIWQKRNFHLIMQ
jgi:hypothetical protein